MQLVHIVVLFHGWTTYRYIQCHVWAYVHVTLSRVHQGRAGDTFPQSGLSWSLGG